MNKYLWLAPFLLLSACDRAEPENKDAENRANEFQNQVEAIQKQLGSV